MRKRIEIEGVVQGVGFRPFVYRIARAHRLAGFVLNSSGGVIVEAEGEDADLESFLTALRSELPPLARIDHLAVIDRAPAGDHGFIIEHSLAAPGHFALVPPDVATCPDCIHDFTTPGNRRFAYPFTNCTNCGPRYTIIRDVPYDRAKTTMDEFRMCARCQAEYENPEDRRFHAEPNACPECGPGLALLTKDELTANRTPQFTTPAHIVEAARTLLKQGAILAIKGLGGFHLACDAANDAAVNLLRERKRRSGKAFAVMVRDLAAAERIAMIGDADRALLTNPRRPIVLLLRREGAAIAAATKRQAMPASALHAALHPLHHLLFEPDALEALVMTSGNMSERAHRQPATKSGVAPHATGRSFPAAQPRHPHARRRFGDPEFRRPRVPGAPFARLCARPRRPGRAGRRSPRLRRRGSRTLSASRKITTRSSSQHIGDLENLETMEFFRETLDHLRRFFRVAPVAVAHDLHPHYLEHEVRAGRIGPSRHRRPAPPRPHRQLDGRQRHPTAK